MNIWRHEKATDDDQTKSDHACALMVKVKVKQPINVTEKLKNLISDTYRLWESIYGVRTVRTQMNENCKLEIKQRWEKRTEKKTKVETSAVALRGHYMHGTRKRNIYIYIYSYAHIHAHKSFEIRINWK